MTSPNLSKGMSREVMNESKLENLTENAIAKEDANWVKVGHFPSLDQAYDYALVILAMGATCRVVESTITGEYALEAEPHLVTYVTEELDAYREESSEREINSEFNIYGLRHSSGFGLSTLWVFILITVFHRQIQDPQLVDRAAASNIGLLRDGEWWRPFTALFLHSNISHLIGNLAGGVVFGSLVARSLGPLIGWILILVCGTLGNIFTASLTYPQAFVSIGASTAVFAALGILSGCGWIETLQEKANQSWLRSISPIFAGIILLGLLGGGHNPNTDVIGHLFGFISGLIVGILAGNLKHR